MAFFLRMKLQVRLQARILLCVTGEALHATALIRKCVETDRYSLSLHFQQRMEQRCLFWGDVQAAIDDPTDVHTPGLDDYGRQKWIIRGGAAAGDPIEIVCAIEATEVDGEQTEFITLYWED